MGVVLMFLGASYRLLDQGRERSQSEAFFSDRESESPKNADFAALAASDAFWNS